MSWWVMEQVSINEAGTQTLANIQCDDVSDLPSPDQSTTLGYVIVRGSQAKVLATSENYILGSTGTWVKMEDGVKLDLTGYATKQYVDAGLADKVDTSVYSSGQAAQETEIGVVAAMGAKNILTPTLTNESTKEGITCTPNPDGTFTLNGTIPTTSSLTNVYFVVVNNEKIKELSNKYGAINVICSGGSDIERSQGRLRFYKIDTNKSTYDSSATNKERSLTLSDNIMDSSANISIVVYRGQTLNNVVIRPMIRLAEITDSTYVPYAPTNRELYEMILALQ